MTATIYSAGLITAKRVRTVTVSGPKTLFDVAVEELGDALAWSRIAKLNKLTDFVVEGIVELAIPERNDALNNGGVPS